MCGKIKCLCKKNEEKIIINNDKIKTLENNILYSLVEP